jgi:hypothetical protein
MHCTVDEAQARTSPQAFIDWLTYWETHPSVKDMINYSQANTSRTIASVNAKRGSSIKLKDFLFDFKRAQMTDDEKLQENRDKVAADLKQLFKKINKV